MKAVAMRRGETDPVVVDRPRPDPGPGEALVRTLRVGVDGTDHEVLEGSHGTFPEGADHMVLGHEAVGVVEDSNDTALEEGEVVVPTIRQQPMAGGEAYYRRGEADMAPMDGTTERGISGAHGFMAEYFTSPEEFLVSLPEELAPLGFLVEPISVSEKALDHARASRSAFTWEPETAAVLGNGPLGLVTLAMLDGFERTYCLGRRDRPDPTIDLIEDTGATYVDSRETPVADLADVHEPMDLVYEATGYARHAFDGIEAVAPNGVLALLGVPEPWSFEVDGGRLHRELVLENKGVVGSVNSGQDHYRAAIDTLANLSETFVDAFVTGVYPLDEYERAFATDEATIKTAVEFTTP